METRLRCGGPRPSRIAFPWPPRSVRSVSRTPKRPVVLIDDEKSYLDLMTLLLTDHLDSPVHGFTSPLAALAALPALVPGVIVTDYNMPELDGLAVVRRATPLVPGTAFVLLSGHNLASDMERVAKFPAIRSVLAKPVGWRVLAQEIIRVWPEGEPAPALRADRPA